MPKVAKELKDIDLRRKTYRTDALGNTAVAFYSVVGVSGLQLRCAPPKGAGKKTIKVLDPVMYAISPFSIYLFQGTGPK